MLEYYFCELKSLRNQWDETPRVNYHGISSIVDLGGQDYRQYDFIMKTSNEFLFDMIADIIKALLKEYKIPVKYYGIRMSDCDMYYVGDKKRLMNHGPLQIEKKILAFSRTDKSKNILYIFKEYGLNKHIPKKLLDYLMKANNLDRYVYISYVESEAYAEILNHNNDKNDPTRGTGIYSLKQFMEGFFSKEEYSLFKSYSKQFADKVEEYYGFALLRTLKPNAVLNFKKVVLDGLGHIGASTIGTIGRIDETQRSIIEQHFFNESNCELLLGSSDFAQSYMTAEWLYASLPNAGKIDLTAIAMGYFKAIEQLLFRFVSLHTHEKDGATRTIYVGHQQYADNRGNVNLTDSFINDSAKIKHLNLGGLTGFFGYNNTNTGQYSPRYQDLLASGINNQTYDIIIESLSEIAGLRNGYFHKDNLYDWTKVDKARETAQLVFYFILGAYSLSDDDKTQLGMIRRNDHDDFYKLCAYINHKYY